MTRVGRVNVLLVSLLLAWPAATRADDPAPATQPADLPSARFDSKFDLNRLADGLIAQYDKDPIGRIAKEMASAADLLAQLNTNVPTQPVQKQIIVGLDELIAMLEKQKKNAKAGGGANPTRPLPDSVIASGPGGQGGMRDPNASARAWGQLPPKQREQILQSQNEGFPPGYESVLSSYYRRLAQESVETPPAPTTQP